MGVTTVDLFQVGQVVSRRLGRSLANRNEDESVIQQIHYGPGDCIKSHLHPTKIDDSTGSGCFGIDTGILGQGIRQHDRVSSVDQA